MSSFLVSEYHIHAILTAFKESKKPYSSISEAELTRIGNTLVKANYKSVNARYNESGKAPKYTFKSVKLHTPIEIFRACHCLEYQSSDYDGWNRSKAKRLLIKIKDYIIWSSEEARNCPVWALDEVRE